MQKRLAGLALAALLGGCENTPVASMPSSNASITVDKLFSNDGCTVYRFHDAGEQHYYVRCDGRSTLGVIEGHSRTCGKGCVQHYDEWIATEQAK